MTTLTILDSRGDTTITWDHDDAKAREEARRTIADLKSKGYLFFLVDGKPADEVEAGKGTLIVRRLAADDVTTQEDEAPVIESESKPDERSRKGRPRKQVIATRPIAGG